MNNTVARAIRILVRLMEGDSLTRHEIAKECKTEVAAADSTMRALSLLPGVSIERGVISCDPRYRVDTPNDVMVLAGAIGLSVASIFGQSAQATSMRKLLRRMMEGGRKAISDVERKFYFVDAGGEIAVEAPEPALDEISEAVRDSKAVRVTYRHNSGREECFRMEPLSLVVFQHQLYVIAKRLSDGMPYPYRLSRVVNADLTSATFEYPAEVDYHPARLFEDTLGVHIAHPGKPETVRFKLTGGWANYPLSHRWHKTQTHEVVADGVVVTLRVRICPEVETLILSFGECAEVLEPEHLRERIAARVRNAVSVYD